MRLIRDPADVDSEWSAEACSTGFDWQPGRHSILSHQCTERFPAPDEPQNPLHKNPDCQNSRNQDPDIIRRQAIQTVLSGDRQAELCQTQQCDLPMAIKRKSRIATPGIPVFPQLILYLAIR